MKSPDFDKLLELRIEKMRATMASKSAEYASDIDKLHNFKRAGQMRNTTPEEALMGMFTKHMVSIMDIVDKIELRNQKIGLKYVINPSHVGITRAMIEEKIGDAVNYLILLEALLKERYEE